MERINKIIIILSFIAIALISNAWAFVLCFAILCACGFSLFSKYYYTVLVPITFVLIAFVCQSIVGIIIGIILLYLLRSAINDEVFNHQYQYPLFWGLITLGFYLYLRFIWVAPLIITIVTLPIIRININHRKRRYVPIVLVSFYTLVIIYALWGVGGTTKRAYLLHGVWADPCTEYDISNLNNASGYSYSEFVKLIDAQVIFDLNKIDNYNELWIVTPTKPFSSTELSIIKKWVRNGGNLIVVSDHTDLYGHARCANQIAMLFGCKIHNSATFDSHNRLFFRSAFYSLVNIKTGTNISGLLFPMVAAWMWEEDAYYANNNFFGPLAPSGDDVFGEKTLAGQIAYGLGQVSFLQDSTIFANFSVFQPYVMDLANLLSRHSFLCRFFLLLPIIMTLMLVLAVLGYKSLLASIIVLFPLTLPINDCKQFNYGNNPQIWSGNHDYVIENGCPYTNISTAFSQASLSLRKPLWIENVNKNVDDVIWVDDIQPPNPLWRWVKVQDIHRCRQTGISEWDSLYSYLDVPCVLSWQNIFSNFQELQVNSIFSDAVMNDWWYNDGVSYSRGQRIKAWVAWLEKKTVKDVPNSVVYSTKKNALIRATGKESIMLQLPLIKGTSGDEVSLGNGVSGIIYQHGDTLSIFGKKPYSENIFCPEIWTIDYLND